MNRQLYQAGSGIGSLDIPMDERILISETLEPESRDYINDELMSAEDREVMERLMELQKNPEYQYDEENMYEGPRDMRMGGGMMDTDQARNMLQDIAPQGEFLAYINPQEAMMLKAMGGAGEPVNQSGIPSFFIKKAFKAITKPIKKVVSKVGDVVGDLDLGDAAKAFVMSGGNPYAAAFAATSGDEKLGFNPFSMMSPSGSGFGDFSFAPQPGGFPGSGSGGTFGFPSGFPGGGDDGIGSILRTGANLLSSFDASRTGGEPQTTTNQIIPGIQNEFLGTILKKVLGKEDSGDITEIDNLDRAAAAALLAKLSYDQRKDLLEKLDAERKQQRADVAKFRDRFQKIRGTGRSTGAPTSSADVVRRPAMMGGIMDTRRGYMMGSEVPMRQNPAGIQELDYRQSGGFVPPIGIKEKADDIPAMLSNNEFVFTADAVRAAGGGSVNKGAQKMYALMKQLEGQA